MCTTLLIILVILIIYTLRNRKEAIEELRLIDKDGTIYMCSLFPNDDHPPKHGIYRLEIRTESGWKTLVEQKIDRDVKLYTESDYIQNQVGRR